MIETYHCPKCGTSLNRSGEIEYEGETLPVFQCDDCTIDAGDMFGSVALTFVVDATGRAFDPVTDEDV